MMIIKTDYVVAALANILSQAFRYGIYNNDDIYEDGDKSEQRFLFNKIIVGALLSKFGSKSVPFAAKVDIFLFECLFNSIRVSFSFPPYFLLLYLLNIALWILIFY